MTIALLIFPIVALIAMASRRAHEGDTPPPKFTWTTRVTVTFQEVRR